MRKYFYNSVLLILVLFSLNANKIKAQDNIIDQVVWVVGDEAILKSDVEEVRREMLINGERFDGDPYCLIPEQIAAQKLFLHQAKQDSIEVTASQVSRMAESRLNQMIIYYGSQEKLEEYEGKSISVLREKLKDIIRDNQIVEEVKDNLTKNVRLTPAEIRKFYTSLSQDSLPFIPTTVEVQILTWKPEIPLREIDNVKNRLRDFTERINKGESSFSTLALMYSEDPESAKRGGEMGFIGRAQLVPEFANAAFALSDPKRISNIVETEFGYHIIQLIERRGDVINTRHILLKPSIPKEVMDAAVSRIDSLVTDIQDNKINFEQAVYLVSSDKDTRNNQGLMVNKAMSGINSGTPRFEMRELPQEIARAVDTLQVGQISRPFIMLNDKGQQVVATVKLKHRTEGHRANISDDYLILKTLVENKKKNDIIRKWLEQKIKSTYVWINDDWRNCDFQYSGWVK